LALASGGKPEALSLARQALDIARSIRSTDSAGSAYMVAKSYRLEGDVQRLLGNPEAAGAAWAQALSALPSPPAENPPEMSERQLILQRLGRTAEAQQLARRISAIGYREPEFRTV
jgi:tetratricopeptide (TPR) repeat protein